jgi:hypothetical protein
MGLQELPVNRQPARVKNAAEQSNRVVIRETLPAAAPAAAHSEICGPSPDIRVAPEDFETVKRLVADPPPAPPALVSALRRLRP